MSGPDGEGAVMSFWEHLEELRRRVIYALVAFLVGVVIAWTFKERLLTFITDPYVEAWRAGKLAGSPSLNFPAPADMFIAYVRLAITGGAVLALPFMLYQLWAFVAPGLYTREKRYALPFVGSSVLLFVGGATFGLKVAFPMAFQFFLGMAGELTPGGLEVKPTIMVGDYVEFVSYLLVAFGLAFELPVVILFLSLAGVVNWRMLWGFTRYFIVIAFAVAAVFTPPDVMSQLLLAVPLCLLYAFSILLAYIFGPKVPAPSKTP